MIGHLLRPEIEELIREKNWDVLRETFCDFHPSDIAEIITDVPESDDVALFRILPRERAGEVFSHLPYHHQEVLVRSLSNDQMRALLTEMTPDDQARLLEELPPTVTRRLLETLSPAERKDARELLGYPADTAGRYMTPEYVALKAGMTAREALEYVRTTGRDKETVNVLYVVDANDRLIDDLRLGTLVMADPNAKIADLFDGPLVSLTSSTSLDEVLRTFEKYDRIALPVTDKNGEMLGIITIDDILDVARKEATRDIQMIGGTEALDAPYMEVSFWEMVKKRGGWLSVLFLGEMLTATAMGHFETEISSAVVLALFVPLIISSGGNSGSQASTLIVRALALSEVTLRDWWRVFGKEVRTSLTLGTWLGFIGFLRIVLWQNLGWMNYGMKDPDHFGEHYLRVAMTVWLSLIGVVGFGSVSGSMLPFILRRIGFDPATSSAPFVATLVDVTGLVIYFSVAMVVLRGTFL
jgi:magnesium transporter